jgi:hypothetical protein
MATFGNTVEGDNTHIITQPPSNSEMTGMVFTCPDGGTATKISACIGIPADVTAANFKCAIYKHSDSTLVAESDVVSVPALTTKTWFDFNLSTIPQVSAQDYVLSILSDGVNARAFVPDIPTGTEHSMDRTYAEGFPSTADFYGFGPFTRLLAIYVTYTPFIYTESIVIAEGISKSVSKTFIETRSG